jgi:predicted metal-dependent peptidase
VTKILYKREVKSAKPYQVLGGCLIRKSYRWLLHHFEIRKKLISVYSVQNKAIEEVR